MRAWTRSGEWPRKNTRFLVRLQAISHGWNHKSSGLRSVRCVMSETCITWLNASVHSEDLQAICLKEAIIMMERWKIGASVFYPSDLLLSGYSCCPVVMKSGSIKKSPPFFTKGGDLFIEFMSWQIYSEKWAIPDFMGVYLSYKRPAVIHCLRHHRRALRCPHGVQSILE